MGQLEHRKRWKKGLLWRVSDNIISRSVISLVLFSFFSHDFFCLQLVGLPTRARAFDNHNAPTARAKPLILAICGGFPCDTGARAVGRPTALMISAMGYSYFGYRRFTGLGQWLRMDDGSLQFGGGQRLPVGCNMRQSTLPSRTLCQVEAWSFPMSGNFFIILANTRPPRLARSVDHLLLECR